MYDYSPREEEIDALLNLRASYFSAKEEKNYSVSDSLRTKLVESGFIPPTFEDWSEVFESSEYRYIRLISRKDFKNHLSGKSVI